MLKAMTTISFIGYGKMAKALFNGWRHHKTYQFQAASPSLAEAITSDGLKTTPNNHAVVPNADILILAVKPFQMPAVMHDIKDLLPPTCLLISVASGLTLDWFANQTPKGIAVIRAMPNIAATVLQSATPLIKNQFVTTHQQQLAEQLFSSIGITTWLHQETQMDIFTALSGSGPAYVFQFIKAMIQAAVKMGIDEQTAKAFALETIKGAVTLASPTHIDLQTLTDQVTSKGGTTAAALAVFDKLGFSETIEKAMKAAQIRAEELGDQQ